MRIWRISNYLDLSGHGGTLSEGRWHKKGFPIVYCSDHPATALLEILVHANRFTVPDFYQLLEIEVPADVAPAVAEVDSNWKNGMEATQSIGTRFLSEQTHALLQVPSVVVAHAYNLLLNPQHPDASRISIMGHGRYPFDSRLFAPS